MKIVQLCCVTFLVSACSSIPAPEREGNYMKVYVLKRIPLSRPEANVISPDSAASPVEKATKNAIVTNKSSRAIQISKTLSIPVDATVDLSDPEYKAALSKMAGKDFEEILAKSPNNARVEKDINGLWIILDKKQ
jgi:hypothetical protein